MPSEDTKILEFNKYKKHDKALFVIYEDLEWLIEKIDGCKNNLENTSTTKVGEHIPSGFSMSIILSFKSIENKHDIYRGKDCIKKFCESLRKHTMKIINFKKKKKWSYWQKSSRNPMKMQKSVIFVRKNLKINRWKLKNITKLMIIVIIQGNIEVVRIAYVIENIVYLKNSYSFS